MWKRHCFAWEYKGKHANLDAAFAQFEAVRASAGEPPLLIVLGTCAGSGSGRTGRTP